MNTRLRTFYEALAACIFCLKGAAVNPQMLHAQMCSADALRITEQRFKEAEGEHLHLFPQHRIYLRVRDLQIMHQRERIC